MGALADARGVRQAIADLRASLATHAPHLGLDAGDGDGRALPFVYQAVDPISVGNLVQSRMQAAVRGRTGSYYTPRKYLDFVTWSTFDYYIARCRPGWSPGEITFMDPACGTGNFLVSAFEALAAHEDRLPMFEPENTSIDLRQFGGMEINEDAAEIARIAMAIAWLRERPGVPIRGEPRILVMDALLDWAGTRRVPAKDRPDPTPAIEDPNTGRMVPDPDALLEYVEYLSPAPSIWPAADIILGNPPFLGAQKQRDRLGDGYVEALRSAYTEIPDGIDLAAYFVYRAGMQVRLGKTKSVGLVTTNSIRQSRNARVTQALLDQGIEIPWVMPDSPWEAGPGAANVRVSMFGLEKRYGGRKMEADLTPVAPPPEPQPDTERRNKYLAITEPVQRRPDPIPVEQPGLFD